jgi:hypothetical protein
MDGYLGIWTGISAEIPAKFGREVVVLETLSDIAVELPRERLMSLTAKINLEDFDPRSSYRTLAETYFSGGADLIAIRELDGRISSIIVIKPSNAKIISRIDSSDKEALREAEAHYASLQPGMPNSLRFLNGMRTTHFRKTARLARRKTRLAGI